MPRHPYSPEIEHMYTLLLNTMEYPPSFCLADATWVELYLEFGLRNSNGHIVEHHYYMYLRTNLRRAVEVVPLTPEKKYLEGVRFQPGISFGTCFLSWSQGVACYRVLKAVPRSCPAPHVFVDSSPVNGVPLTISSRNNDSWQSATRTALFDPSVTICADFKHPQLLGGAWSGGDRPVRNNHVSGVLCCTVF